MNNMFTIIGRLNEIGNIEEENNKRYIKISVMVQSMFKNEHGEYNNWYIIVKMSENISYSLKKYCNIGDIIGVKGHIESVSNNSNVLVADKVTFLSSRQNNEEL